MLIVVANETAAATTGIVLSTSEWIFKIKKIHSLKTVGQIKW